MPVPKAGVGVYEWIDYKQVCGTVYGGTPSYDFSFYLELSRQLGMELVQTAPFCAAAQPAPVTISEADILDGSWKEKLKQHLKAQFYFNICEEE